MKYNVKRQEVLFFLGLFFINLYYGLNDTELEFNGSFNLLIIGVTILIFHIFLFNKYKIGELFFLICLFGIFTANYWKYRDSRILVLLIIISSIRQLDIVKILKFIFWEQLGLFLLIVSSALLGIISITTRVADDRGIRYAFGYSHPNQMMVMVIVLLMLYICSYWEKIEVYHWGIMLIVFALTALITRSRTGFLIGMIIGIFFLLNKYFGVKKTFELLGKFLPSILFGLSIFLPLSLSLSVSKYLKLDMRYRAFVIYLDRALNSRLTLSYRMLRISKIGLFGSVTDTSQLMQYNYNVLDSGYVQILLTFGIIGSILFLVLIYLMVKQLIRREQYAYLIAFVGLTMYAFTENVYCSLKYNFLLILIAEVFYKKEETFFVNKKIKLKKLSDR